MNEYFTFDDVLIKPKFSTVNSRKDVVLATNIFDANFDLPIMAANMDTVCGPEMAIALGKQGAIPGVLHRFWSIEDNVEAAKKVIEAGYKVWCSVGIGEKEYSRYVSLSNAGVSNFVLDVANAAQLQVVYWYKKYRDYNACLNFIVVGNFATKESVEDFIFYLNEDGSNKIKPDAIKINIGAGSACTTRVQTGCGIPQLSALLECSKLNIPMIADGGMKTSGDCAKALAVKNVVALMTGGLLAGTDETPGEIIEEHSQESVYVSNNWKLNLPGKKYKKYRGSASKESYDVQGKDSSYITAEGESFETLYKGPVAQVLQDISGSLRSAFTYVGARNVQDFQEKAEFIRITSNGVRENGAYGKV